MSESVKPVTAVFDVGKTNKKFILFDGDYNIVCRKQTTLRQSVDDDGDPCEDLPLLTSWIRKELSAALKDSRFRIGSLNFSGYGASLVHLDDGGQAIGYLYDYMKPFPEDVKDQFYETCGGKEKISIETASPPMGMLNSGLQLYWLKKKKPDLFRRIRWSLHFPQYLSYLITGEISSELTSVGCHTVMWDFRTGTYHRWLEQEGMLDLLPGIQPVSKLSDSVYEGVELKTGPGIHDSSAALAPYLQALDDPFLLLSTGTWSITFNPFSRDPLTFEELQMDCLCYMNIYGEQVKAARVFLGNEYRFQKEKLIRLFNVRNDDGDIALDRELLENLIRTSGPEKKLKLETAYNTGPFPSGSPGEWEVGRFASYEEAYHQLMLDLVVIQEKCIMLAEGSGQIENVIVTGGFGYNEFFLNLLASRLPDKNIYTATMPHATALGCALVMRNEKSADLKRLLDLKLHPGLEMAGISRYSWNGE